MTTTTALDPATAEVTAAHGRTRTASARIPLTRIVGVELRKMFDTRSGFWLMASIVITSVLATAAIIVFAPDDQQTYENFAAAMERAGLTVTHSDGSVHTDATPEQVGEVALGAGLALTELRAADGAGLEEMFLELTADTQREGAAA